MNFFKNEDPTYCSQIITNQLVLTCSSVGATVAPTEEHVKMINVCFGWTFSTHAYGLRETGRTNISKTEAFNDLRNLL